MKVVVSGASGLIGSALTSALAARGDQVLHLVRATSTDDPEAICWDPLSGVLDAARLDGADAVVHLAGAGIADARWTRDRKTLIRDSRVRGTRLLADALCRMRVPPRVFVSASAVGIYGDRPPGDVVTEESGAGDGFLAHLCRDWEAAADPARQKGVRVVHPRFGLVLARHGGALPRMVSLFRLGLGGKLGSGRQMMSWITLDDAAGVLLRLLDDAALKGPVNVTAPHPESNAQFTRQLARCLGRPAFLPAPAPLLRLVLGEMADELLLSGVCAVPRKLLFAGHRFAHPALEGALRHVLGP